MVRLPSFKKLFRKEHINIMAGTAASVLVVEPVLNSIAGMLPLPTFMGIGPDDILKLPVGLWMSGKKGIVKGIGIGLVAMTTARIASRLIGGIGPLSGTVGNPVLITPPNLSTLTNVPPVNTRDVSMQFGAG